MRCFQIVICLGLTLSLTLLCSCSSSPTETPSLALLDGTWQETFTIPDIGGIAVIEDALVGDSLPADLRTIVATLILHQGRFISEVDRSASLFPTCHRPSPIEGTYWVKGDTIAFCESTGGIQCQQFRLQLQRESLCLAYLLETDTLDSGATVGILPLGCLPWHNAWMKHQGTFARTAWPNRE